MIGRSLSLMSICLVVAVVCAEDKPSDESFEDGAKKIYGMCCNLKKGLKEGKVKDFADCTDSDPNPACFTKYLMKVGNGEDITKTAEKVFREACNENSETAIPAMEKIIKEEYKMCQILPEAKAKKTMDCLVKVLGSVDDCTKVGQE